jgi:hypothetical protein
MGVGRLVRLGVVDIDEAVRYGARKEADDTLPFGRVDEPSPVVPTQDGAERLRSRVFETNSPNRPQEVSRCRQCR